MKGDDAVDGHYPCRWCGEKMNPGAVRCHYCQAWQDPDANKKAQILDEGIIYWGKFLGGLAALLAVVLLASGGLDLYHAKDAAVDAKNDAEKSKIDAKEAVSLAQYEYQNAKNAAAGMKNDVTSMSLDAKKSLDQALDDAKKKTDSSIAEFEKAEKGLQETGKRIDDIATRSAANANLSESNEKAIEAHRKTIEGLVETVRQAANTVTGDINFIAGGQESGGLQNYGEIIKGLQKQIADLQAQVVLLEQHVPAAGVVPPPPADLDKLRDILAIKQTSVAVPGSDTRRSYDVTFSVCSPAGVTCNDTRLNEVSQVVYRFDRRWFSVPDVTAANVASGFSYTVRVWGITTATACIFIKGATDDPIVRSGRIALGADTPAFWGSETSDAPDNCSDFLPNRKLESQLNRP